jgi:hypothetical protein
MTAIVIKTVGAAAGVFCLLPAACCLLPSIFYAALPPDVRKVFDLPVSLVFYPGLRPRRGATWGEAPTEIGSACRKVRDLPHIRRQSRKEFS